MTALDRLITSLQDHEGFRATVYDDATGQPIGPGSTLKGHPTIGYGWAVDVHPMSRTQGVQFLRDVVHETIFTLTHRIPWVLELDEPRQNVLYELAYNLGVDGLLLFSRMLAALKARRYAEAAEHLLDSRWAEQVGPRRARALATQLVSGEWALR